MRACFFLDDGLLTVASHGKRDKGAFWGLFNDSTNSIHGGAHFHDLITSQRPAPPNAITLGVRFSTYELGEGHIQSVAVDLHMVIDGSLPNIFLTEKNFHFRW